MTWSTPAAASASATGASLTNCGRAPTTLTTRMPCPPTLSSSAARTTLDSLRRRVVSAPVTADARLAQPEVLTYWDSRHKAQGELRSGGDLGYDHPNNEIFYALRVGRLIDAVGDIGEPLGPLRVLDAGCGKGYFARSMGRFGHVVDGIDAS